MIQFTNKQRKLQAIRDIKMMLGNHTFDRNKLANTMQYYNVLHGEASAMRGNMLSLIGRIKRLNDDMTKHIRDGDAFIAQMRE